MHSVTHRDSTNTNVSNGYSKPTCTILRKPKKQSSSVSTTSSKEPGVRGVSYEEDFIETGSGNGCHYERPPTSKYRILKPKKSSSSFEDEGEDNKSSKEKKSAIKRPVPPPLPPMAPRGAKPTTAPTKKVFLATNSGLKERSTSNGTISYDTSSSEEASTKSSASAASGGKVVETESESDSASEHQSAAHSSMPNSIPSALRPYEDHSARSSAEVEDVDEEEEEEEEENIVTTQQPQTVRRLPLVEGGRTSADEDSSPDSSLQALAEGGSTSPSSTRSSDFTTKSPIND